MSDTCICSNKENIDNSYTINVNCDLHGYNGYHNGEGLKMSEQGRIVYDVTPETCKHGKRYNECADCMAKEQTMSEQGRTNYLREKGEVQPTVPLTDYGKINTCEHGVNATRCTECKELQSLQNMNMQPRCYHGNIEDHCNDCRELNSLKLDNVTTKISNVDLTQIFINKYGLPVWLQHAEMSAIHYLWRCRERSNYIEDIKKVKELMDRILTEFKG